MLLTQFAPAELETLHACPYCDSGELHYLFVERGYPYVECRACGLIIVATRLREECLAALRLREGSRLEDATGASRRVASERARLLGDLPPSTKVFDEEASATSEYFAAECRARGFEVTRSARGLAEARLPDSSLDAVATFEGLSQLYRPREYFREVARVLRPGGVWLTRVRDVQGWKMRFGRGQGEAPFHVLHYSLSLVERMAREAGLQKVLVQADSVDTHSEPSGASERGKQGARGSLLESTIRLLQRARARIEGPGQAYYLRFVK